MAKKPTKAAKRAALDRILAAVNAEVKAGLVTSPGAAIGWLAYAQTRDDAADAERHNREEAEALGEEVETNSPMLELEAERDCFYDDRPDWDGTLGSLAWEMGELFDPDFEKPIDPKTHKSWL